MSFTSIKVRREDKQQFDRLLHEFALERGERISQHELFHRILEHALAAKDDVIGPAARRHGRSWSDLQFDLDTPTDAASEIDRVVYGLDE